MRHLIAGLLTLGVLVWLIWVRPRHQAPPPPQNGALQSMMYLNLARSYPASRLPSRGITEAFQQLQLNQAGKSSPLVEWTSLGPLNISGRMLSIAVDPRDRDVLYAGSASGGLWRSETGCQNLGNWQSIQTGFPVLGVAAIAIDPSNSDVLYIGTGENYGSEENFPGIVADRTMRGSYGIGILKSTDRGVTWSKSLDWTLEQQRSIQKIRINPLRPETVWAATSEGTYRSYDAGNTWEPALDIPMATDVRMSPQDTSILFVANGNRGSEGHGIYRSVDAGNTWTLLDLGPDGPASYQGKALLDISLSSPQVIMASIGFSNGHLPGFPGFVEPATWLLRSDDGGDSWRVNSTINYAGIQGWYAHALAIHPISPDTVWTAGQPFTPFLSTNGGNNLTAAQSLELFEPVQEAPEEMSPLEFPYQHWWADYHDILYDDQNPSRIYFANDGGIFYTQDGGKTVANCNRGLQTTQFYNGFSNSATNPLLALGGLQDNNTVLFEGDPFWRRVGGGDGGWTAINQFNNDILYVSSQFGNLRRSPDRFLDSLAAIRPEELSEDRTRTNFIAPYMLSPVDNSTLYLGADVVFKSLDGGFTWAPTNNGSQLDGNNMISMALSRQSVDVVYVATSPGITRPGLHRTRNGGETWTNITGSLPDRLPTDLHVDPNDDQTLYVTLGGFGTPHLYRSRDGGDQWTAISEGLPDIPTWSITTDPADSKLLFVGNDIGIYQSIDDGLSWEPIMEGLPEVLLAIDLSVSPSNRMLRVASHGSGAFERPLPGLATSIQADEVISVSVQAIFPNPSSTRAQVRVLLQQPGDVRYALFDIQGKRVRPWAERRLAAGTHLIPFDLMDLASGHYFLLFEAGGHQVTRMITRTR